MERVINYSIFFYFLTSLFFTNSFLGPLIFWDPKWGNIDRKAFIKHIVPVLDSYMRSHPGLLFQQDNAGAHGARDTQTELRNRGIEVIAWPASSPDLNPIENIWQRIKQRLRRRHECPHNVEELKALVADEWSRITIEEIRDLIKTMHNRMAAVIRAHGGHTKY
jgi:transposase